MFGEVIHDQVDELDLIGAKRLARQESSQRLLGGFAVKAHERTHEHAKAVRFGLGPGEVVRPTDSAFRQHPLELGQV